MDTDMHFEKLTMQDNNETVKPLAKLEDLPPEILFDIFCYLPKAQALRSLSLCNHKLHEAVRSEGWKAFIRSQFPSMSPGVIALGANAEDAAQSMTALSRSWDRRAVLATRLHPGNDDPHFGRDSHQETPRRPWAHWRPRFRFRQRGQQTIGFQPVIDSQEEVLDSDWRRRREYVVWGAGSQLGFRLKHTGMGSEEHAKEQGLGKVDQHGNASQWNTFQPESSHDGADDITALKLLSRDYVGRYSTEPSKKVNTITGTAAGRLAMSKFEVQMGQEAVLKKDFVYRTGRISSVRSLDVSPSEDLLISGYSNGLLLLHFVYNRDRKGFPISSVAIGHKHGHLWATRFLSNSVIAVGTGRSYEPLHVYSLGPGGLSDSPTRTWTLTDGGSSSEVFGSIGCIERLPESPGLSSDFVFLSGHTDGSVRLHDLRSSSSQEAIFSDPVDDGAVFSLVTKGRERLVAGNSRNSLLKMFDIRMTGGRVYSYRDASAFQDPPVLSSGSGEPKNGWSMFLHPGESATLSNPRGHSRNSSLTSSIGDARASASPVYSLSTPSVYSPSIFAGMEAQVTQIDVVDVFDQHPDPVYNAHQAKTVGAKWFWDPADTSKNLAYYEHARANKLKRQAPDWPSEISTVVDTDFDYRWRELGQ